MGKHRKHHSGDDLTIEQRQKLYYRKVCHIIEEHGFFIQAVMAGDGFPSFAYTVGLAPDTSERILFGLPDETAGHIFHEVVNREREGQQFENLHAYIGLVEGMLPLYFKNITDEEELWSQHMRMAVRWHNEHGRLIFPIQQIIWPDTHGKFPWQEGFEERFREEQPLLFAPDLEFMDVYPITLLKGGVQDL